MTDERIVLDEGDPAAQARIRAPSSATRLRVLRLCAFESRTNKELAELLGINPGTMLHHVRTLVDTGFLEATEARRGRRGSREIPYRATGKSWYLTTPLGTSSIVEAFLTELQAVPEEQRDLVRLGLRLPAG